MDCPYFTVINYSAFDSEIAYKKERKQKERLITAYELEFYTEDCPGGLIINGKRYPVQRGSFTCTKPGQQQRMVLPYKCYFLNLYTEDPGLREMLDRLPEYGVLWEMDAVVETFLDMLTVDNLAQLPNKLRLDSCVLRILSLLAGTPNLPDYKAADNALQHRQLLQKADRYIQEHYAENIRLETLARLCNLHPNYFHRLYTEAFGMTPSRRILTCRIAGVKTLLLTGNASVSEIAAQCGFSSQTYMGYKFKEISGMTPLQFRRTHLSRR